MSPTAVRPSPHRRGPACRSGTRPPRPHTARYAPLPTTHAAKRPLTATISATGTRFRLGVLLAVPTLVIGVTGWCVAHGLAMNDETASTHNQGSNQGKKGRPHWDLLAPRRNLANRTGGQRPVVRLLVIGLPAVAPAVARRSGDPRHPAPSAAPGGKQGSRAPHLRFTGRIRPTGHFTSSSGDWAARSGGLRIHRGSERYRR